MFATHAISAEGKKILLLFNICKLSHPYRRQVSSKGEINREREREARRVGETERAVSHFRMPSIPQAVKGEAGTERNNSNRGSSTPGILRSSLFGSV